MSAQPKHNDKRFSVLDMLLIMLAAVLLFALGAYGAVHGWLSHDRLGVGSLPAYLTPSPAQRG